MAIAATSHGLTLSSGLRGQWTQTLDDVEVQFDAGASGRSTAPKDWQVQVQPNSLAVQCAGESLLAGQLQHTVLASEALWTVDDGVLEITLPKAAPGTAWTGLLADSEAVPAGRLSADQQQAEKQRLMLERFSAEHPGFDFSQATFNGEVPDARTFMGGMPPRP